MDTMSATHADPTSLDLMFPQELSFSTTSFRPSDYKHGHVDAPSVLFIVNDLGEVACVNQFHAMRAYFSFVGVSTVFIERKFPAVSVTLRISPSTKASRTRSLALISSRLSHISVREDSNHRTETTPSKLLSTLIEFLWNRPLFQQSIAWRSPVARKF
ncbi:hypothetical protein DFJ58DRAFT_27181 [Suillus subalutaceus]|uniref:uncharacterized protein n=1 Tax=Suillus subalutaceus TaxID=48586 RepID=UPI001B85BE64|nr:uncharacterized protein DFJ58DRAFT_27181 [Suillus subalutaceus]KAG1844515.1 hypothetical protein DFJ58DRAFT_27181 [Suillus subalutaceus]